MPTVYRVAKQRHPIFDGAGAFARGGRWTSPGRLVVYAAEHYATSLLEILVNAGRTALPGPHHAAAIHLPDDLPHEWVDPAAIEGWELEGSPAARALGDAWYARGATAVLYVPSVPGRPVERNVVINLGHPDAARITVGAPFDVVWDTRLFDGPPVTVA
ncbi:MAG TPA: RES domain-containing protein [Gemmatimonadales bacterium]|nr:RES domain-containing protein [Gemmatimonadales bacterium]